MVETGVPVLSYMAHDCPSWGTPGWEVGLLCTGEEEEVVVVVGHSLLLLEEPYSELQLEEGGDLH